MTDYMNPFDFKAIFVNTLAGSWTVFIFLAIIGLSYLAGKFRMNDRVFLGVLVLFGIIMSPYIGGLYALLIIIVGLVVYHGIAKIVKY